jgi:putative two-component system response regulator
MKTNPAAGNLLAGVRALVVEDNEHALQFLELLLCSHGCDVRTAQTGAEALNELRLRPDWTEVVLCDLNLPDMSGMDIIRIGLVRLPALATILMTGEDDQVAAAKVIALGAYGYMTKPFRTTEVLMAVHNASRRRQMMLAMERTTALREQSLQEETIHRLASAAEMRDIETGKHIERMSQYCALIAEQLGLAPERVELLRMASPLHDVGKIGIPDAVLLKPGRLDAQERQEIERHPDIGYQILADSDSELLRLAASLALTHHERYDGTGYPRGISGDQIPIEGRIAAVADVFDALTSDRVYRPALSVTDAVRMMVSERGKHFDPDVLDTFVGCLDAIVATRAALLEDPPSSSLAA